MSYIRRSLERFRDNPASTKRAVAAIVNVTVAAVVLGAVAVRLFDSEDYPTFGRALWFTLQTVTTVGYGDATPTTAVGRVVAAVVMLTGIGIITVITAAVTSVFVEAARVEETRRRAEENAAGSRLLARLEASLDDIVDRLDRLESAMSGNPATHREDTDPDDAEK